MSRRTGRTSRALAKLPDGAIYVVVARPCIDHSRSLLVNMGRAPDCIRFVTLDRIDTALMGLPRSTVLDVDHFVYELASEKQRALLRMFGLRYTLPPVKSAGPVGA